jgi:hypothetical protein
MHDKRVHRGNSYAAMVIPAGTNHDTMVMEKKQTQKRTFRSSNPNVSLPISIKSEDCLANLKDSQYLSQQRHPFTRTSSWEKACRILD